MGEQLSRRYFLGTAGAALTATGTALAHGESSPEKLRIVGVATSFRQGKTTAAALEIALESAAAVAPELIETELIELAGLHISGAPAAGVPLAEGEKDDFPAVAEKLSSPALAGLIVGTPTYFGNMSSLCKAFLERLMLFRKNDFALSNTVAGVLATGGVRNGGQEIAIHSIRTALFTQEMIVVGESRPTAHGGPVLWNKGDDITWDDIGVGATKNLGRRVAEVALRIAGASA